jgi:glucose/arabinose dehydrogenase
MRLLNLKLTCIAIMVALLATIARIAAQTNPVIVAPGFQFNLFADPARVPQFANMFSGPASLAFDARGRLFVGTLAGKILILLDNNDDGVVDQVKVFASFAPQVQVLGLEFNAKGDLFASSNVYLGTGRILRLRDTDGDDAADEITTIVDNLPSSGEHQTDRLKFGPDGLLYFGQGSATDNGQPKPGRPAESPLNAKILRVSVDSANPSVEIFAKGLRNPFGMAFHPENGALFATDGGSGEFGQIPDTSPPDEINWVVQGGDYGFPKCEGMPTPDNPDCAGVRAPIFQFRPHLTPTSIAFYTGPQAADSKNQMLVTLFKHLYGEGGSLLRFTLSGDAVSGFQLTPVNPPIADLGIIDPGDGPVDIAIDPISGDIYVARVDTVIHADPNEHHNFIYRIHRAGSDSLPLIGPVRPPSIKAGTGPTTINLIGRHLKPGAVVLADGSPLTTRQGPSIFELLADLPASLTASERTIRIEVQNPDGARSNAQVISVTRSEPAEKSPQLSSLSVIKLKNGRPIDQLVAGMKAKKLRLVVNGSDFDSGAQLLVAGVALQLDSASPTQLVGQLTQAMLDAPAELTVQVRNSTGKLSNTLKLVVASGQ